METIETTFERYAAYKDSGVEWLGEIPEHWEVVAIKRVLAIPITDGPHTTPELIEEGIPFISAESIKNGKIDFSKKRGFIFEKNHLLFSKKYNPQLWDIYMVKSGATTGNTAIVETNKTFSIWSPLAVFRANKQKVSPRYLNLFLQSSTFKISVELSWSFGTQQNIGMGILSNLPMSVPPLSEQTRIAEFLDRKTAQIDQAIAQKERLIELLKERRQVMIHQAVTRGLNPDVPLKHSGIEWIGEIPEHWEVKKLKYFVNIQGGFAFNSAHFKNEGVQLIKIANTYLNKLSLDRQPTFLDFSFLESHRNWVVTKNDILMSLTGTLGKKDYGYAILLESDEKYLLNQRVARIIPKSKVGAKYILNILQSEMYLNQLYMLPSGTKQANLSNDDVLNIKITYSPDQYERESIVNFIYDVSNSTDNILANASNQIQKLQELKATLINASVTGKIKVS